MRDSHGNSVITLLLASRSTSADRAETVLNEEVIKKQNAWYGVYLQLEDYQEELEEMKNMTRQEYVAHLRRYKFDLAS